MLIAIEGCDAAGKATQSKLLAEKLGGTRFSFPNYDSPTGTAILGHLKKKWSAFEIGGLPTFFAADPGRYAQQEKLNALVFQSLQTVNRIELLPKIREALTKGPVVFDRYWVSAVVYGGLDGLDREWLRAVQEGPMPPADVQILLDVPVEEGFKRRPERRDRYESDRPFLEKVRREYLRVFGFDEISIEEWDGRRMIRDGLPLSSPSWVNRKGSWFVVDGLGAVDEVHDRIAKALSAHDRGDCR